MDESHGRPGTSDGDGRMTDFLLRAMFMAVVVSSAALIVSAALAFLLVNLWTEDEQ